MSLLSDIENELRNAFPTLAGDVKRILTPFEARVNAMAPGAIRSVQDGAGVRTADQGLPYQIITLDLATLPITKAGQFSKKFDVPGNSLYFRKRGSSYAAALDIYMGGLFPVFSPGNRLQGAFDSFGVSLNPQSAIQTGTVSLIVEKLPGVYFCEDDVKSVEPLFLKSGNLSGAQTFDFGNVDVSSYDMVIGALSCGSAGGTTNLQWAERMLGAASDIFGNLSIITVAPPTATTSGVQLIQIGQGLQSSTNAGSSTKTIDSNNNTYVGSWKPLFGSFQITLTGGTLAYDFRAWGLKTGG